MVKKSRAASSSGALQPTEQVNASQLDVTEVWARIHKFGRFPKKQAFPKRVLDPQSEAEHEENTLWNFLYNATQRNWESQMMCGQR